jgi:hypothetical protein
MVVSCASRLPDLWLGKPMLAGQRVPPLAYKYSSSVYMQKTILHTLDKDIHIPDSLIGYKSLSTYNQVRRGKSLRDADRGL